MSAVVSGTKKRPRGRLVALLAMMTTIGGAHVAVAQESSSIAASTATSTAASTPTAPSTAEPASEGVATTELVPPAASNVGALGSEPASSGTPGTPAASTPATSTPIEAARARCTPVFETFQGIFLGTVPRLGCARTPIGFEAGAQLFAQYDLKLTEGEDWYHSVDLTRVWLFSAFRIHDVVGRVLLEGARAGGSGSLIGVGGDSIVARFREAWVGYSLGPATTFTEHFLEVRAGLVPTLATPRLSQLFGLRAVDRIPLRERELMQPADVGATARARLGDLPSSIITVGVGFYTGEGYRSRERNRGKTLEVMAELHPLSPLGVPELGVLLTYESGSEGAASVRADRMVGTIFWDSPSLGLGADVAYVLGLEDRGDREALLVDGWARFETLRVDGLDRLVLGAQASHFLRDLARGGDTQTTLSLMAGARIDSPLRVFAAFDGRWAGDAARAVLPGYVGYDLRVVVEGNLGVRWLGEVEGL